MLSNAVAIATIPAEDPERARAFYRDVLGLKVINSYPDGSAFFEAGDGSRIFMYPRGRSTAEHTAITFGVQNLQEVVKGLTARGVSFEQYDFEDFKTDELGIAEMEGTRMAWLTDPEGNILAVGEIPA